MKPIHAYYVLIISLTLACPAYIAANEWSKRACADPRAWAQKSVGHALTECEAEGGDFYLNTYRRIATCTKSVEVQAR